MSWSLNIGSIAGTAIRIHITFLLFLVWIFVASYVSGGAEAAWQALAFMLLLFACVLAHEFGHIFTARAFGVATPDVTLLPIGGVARLERIPEKPREEFLIAIAGPAGQRRDRARAGRCSPARTLDTRRSRRGREHATSRMIDRLAAVNLFLALFNMIPAFPMDGGRVLRALLATPARLSCARPRSPPSIGQGVAFALGFIGLFCNPMLIFIAIFVYLAAASEAHLVAMRAMSRGVPVERRDDDAIRDADAGRAYRRGGPDVAAHQPERISGGRRRRQAGRPARPRRSHPRAEGARPRRPRRRRDDDARADHRPSPLPRRGIPHPAGEIRARGRAWSTPPAGWSGWSRRRPSARC